MRLLLFDIDGTLMDSGGAGLRALDRAIENVCAIPNATRSVEPAGKTDPLIIREACQGHGITPTESEVQEIIAQYLSALPQEMENTRKHLKPGVRQLLQRIREERDAGEPLYTGILTGNVAEGARIKLAAFAIDQCFSFGAYGSDHEDRNELVPFAVSRFVRLTGIKAVTEDCVVIGDTDRDVQCARAHGAQAIAVATGPFTAEALRRTGADAVFEDLSDTQSVLASLSVRR